MFAVVTIVAFSITLYDQWTVYCWPSFAGFFFPPFFYQRKNSWHYYFRYCGHLYTTSFVGVSILFFVASLRFLVVMIFIGTDTVHYHVHKGKTTPYNKVISAQVSATDRQYKQSQKRWRRATITYGLLVLSFSSFTSLLIVRIVLLSIFEKSIVS